MLVEGVRGTRGVLADWNARPFAVIGPWVIGAALIALGLLLSVWAIANAVTPDTTQYRVAGVNSRAALGDVGHILARNSLVLALHAFACVAGFIAGSSLPREAERYSGAWRWIHDKAGPLAILFVVCATWFSLATQAYVLGNIASTTAAYLATSPGRLLLGLSLHALPELTALFMPLAAWVIASRSGRWSELLAATFVTVTIAAPVLVVCAFVEVYVSPHLVMALR